MQLWQKLYTHVLPVILLLLCYELLLTEAYMKSVRIAEIPFGRQQTETVVNQEAVAAFKTAKQGGLHVLKKFEQQRGFFHLFHVPYIICFFAAKGKWPFIPPFLQARVDNAARTFFHQNDSFIRNFCKKWLQIKECFRPIFNQTSDTNNVDIETLTLQKRCNCNALVSTESTVPVVYFDKNYIGNVSADTILNTIEFLESFLPTPTKRGKRKNNRVRSRLDEIEIE